MNNVVIEGGWKRLSGKIKVHDSCETGFPDDRVARLAGTLQELYGVNSDQAQRQVDQWRRSLSA